jgi:hypothetical protein
MPHIIIIIIIISLPRLKPSGLLQSHTSVCKVSPKIFPNLVGEIEFLSGELEEWIFRSAL